MRRRSVTKLQTLEARHPGLNQKVYAMFAEFWPVAEVKQMIRCQYGERISLRSLERYKSRQWRTQREVVRDASEALAQFAADSIVSADGDEFVQDIIGYALREFLPSLFAREHLALCREVFESKMLECGGVLRSRGVKRNAGARVADLRRKFGLRRGLPESGNVDRVPFLQWELAKVLHSRILTWEERTVEKKSAKVDPKVKTIFCPQ